ETHSRENIDALDAFSIADGMLSTSPVDRTPEQQVHPNLDYRSILKLFPQPQLARRIFGTLENGRVDRQLRRKYRGLGRDLDLVREHLRRNRPKVAELPPTLVPFEFLFQ